MTSAVKAQETALRDAYDRDGFVIVEKLLTPALLDGIRADTDAAVENRVAPIAFDLVSPEAHRAVPERYRDNQGRIFRRLNGVIDRGGAFESIVFGPLAQAAAQILPAPIYVCLNRHNMVMLKAPFNPGSVPWHQDAAVWNEGTFDHLSAIVAIDDFRKDNGCLQVIPGSHRVGPAGLGWEGNTSQIKARHEELVRDQAVPVELKAGDALLFHGLTLHGSPGNTTAFSRRSLTICYYPGDLTRVSTRQNDGNDSDSRPIVRMVVPAI